MSERKTLVWKDTTSYRRDDKDRVPSVWELRTADCRIVVYKDRHVPERWQMSVYGVMRIENMVLGAKTEREAQHEGLKMVSTIAKNVVDGLPRFD